MTVSYLIGVVQVIFYMLILYILKDSMFTTFTQITMVIKDSTWHLTYLKMLFNGYELAVLLILQSNKS